MTVTRLDAEQMVAFQDAMKPVWDEYREKIGAELIQSAVDTK